MEASRGITASSDRRYCGDWISTESPVSAWELPWGRSWGGVGRRFESERVEAGFEPFVCGEATS